jgi:hypothetical protein
MPRVPVLNQQVRLAPLPGPTVSSNASPALLGGITAKAMSNAGDDMLRGGVILQRMQADEQEKVNAVRVNDATNKLIEAKLRLTHDKVDGYTVRRGVNALTGENGMPLEDEYAGKLDTHISEITAGLGNEYQKQVFRQQADQLKTQFRGSIQQHTAREFNVHRGEVLESRIKLSDQQIAANWGNPEEVGPANEAKRKTMVEIGHMLGWEKTTLDAKTAEVMSPGHLVVINAAADAGQLDYARAYMNQSRNELTPAALDNANKVLKTGDFETRTQTMTEDVLKQAKGNHPLAMKLAREKFSGKEEDGVIMRLKQMNAEVEQFREQSQRRGNEAGWTYYNKGGDLGKMPPSLINAMDPHALHVLRKTAEAEAEGGVKTDPAVYNKLSRLSVEDPSAFQKTDMLLHSDKLSPSHRTHFMDLQTKMAKEGQAPVTTLQGQVDTVIKKIGLKGEKAGKFSMAAEDSLQAAQQIKGAALTYAERQTVLDGLLKEGKTTGGWFGRDTSATFYEAKSENKVFKNPEWSEADYALARESLKLIGNNNPSIDQLQIVLRSHYGMPDL